MSVQEEKPDVPKMGRPSQGRDLRVQVQVTEDVYNWLVTQKEYPTQSMSDVLFRILEGLRNG